MASASALRFAVPMSIGANVGSHTLQTSCPVHKQVVHKTRKPTFAPIARTVQKGARHATARAFALAHFVSRARVA